MSNQGRHVLRAPAAAGRLDAFVGSAVEDLSRSRAQALIHEGRVWVDGVPGRPAHRLRGGEEVVVDIPPPRPAAALPEDIPLTLLHEDDDVIVLYKPAGLVVHPAAGHWTGTLVNALLHAVPDLEGVGGEERPGLVHRLDKGTSGILVVARNDVALRALQAQFSIHSVERRYLAVVHGVPRVEGGTVVSQLGRHPRDRQRFCSVRDGGRRAVTHWRRVAVGDRVALLACRLETGRTHQVRVHLSEQGLPIVGDPVYGPRSAKLPPGLLTRREGLDHQLLHAGLLAFDHPRDGRRLRFTGSPPSDFQAFCDAADLRVPDLGGIAFGG